MQRANDVTRARRASGQPADAAGGRHGRHLERMTSGFLGGRPDGLELTTDSVS